MAVAPRRFDVVLRHQELRQARRLQRCPTDRPTYRTRAHTCHRTITWPPCLVLRPLSVMLAKLALLAAGDVVEATVQVTRTLTADPSAASGARAALAFIIGCLASP